MRTVRAFLGSFWLIIPILSGSVQAAKISLVAEGAYSHYQLSENDAATTEAKRAFGAGLLFEFRLNRKTLGIEAGAIYQFRKSMLNNVIYSYPYLQFPLTLNYWPTQWFHASAGVYYAQGKGEITSTASAGGNTFSDLGMKGNDYGMLAGLGLNLPFSFLRQIALRIEGRYVLGLANIGQDSQTSGRWQDLQGLVGLRFSTKR